MNHEKYDTSKVKTITLNGKKYIDMSVIEDIKAELHALWDNEPCVTEHGCDKYEKGSFGGTTPIDGYGFSLVSHNRKQFNKMAYSQEDKGV